jgi:hypothetical protein
LGETTPAVTADPAATPEAIAAKAATDAQAATEAKATADAKVAADALAAAGAPEKYEFKPAEGKAAYDSNLIAAFEAGARNANMPQLAAQKLLDSMSPVLAERQSEQVTAIRKEWFDASSADKEFGGANLVPNLAVAKKALDTFGSPELSKLLVSTGLGSHPEMIRLMFRAGKALSEDTFVAGTGPAAGQVKASAVLYDKTTT